ncbi:MAG: class F sortase [Patescibacteria group bacterium]|nr:class F sortase [Patescibacteria group bacterium]
MQKILPGAFAIVLFIFIAPAESPQTPLPLIPQTALAQAPSPVPVSVIIPAIGVNSPIEDVGVLPNGELDVPSGSTGNVGWYAAGTIPGDIGSAVLDAHVFAAFSKLHNLKTGDDIYIGTSAGSTLHFVIEESDTYQLAQVPLQQLFNRSDAPRLNLITCAGSMTPDHSTYDHRLVVYAVLAKN